MDFWTLVIVGFVAQLPALILAIGSGIGFLMVRRAQKRLSDAQSEQAEGAGAEAITRANVLLLKPLNEQIAGLLKDNENFKKKIESLEKSDEAKTRQIAQMATTIDAQGKTIISQSNEISSLRMELRDKSDALDYLMDEARAVIPEKVIVAGEYASGKRKRPVSGNDPTETHE